MLGRDAGRYDPGAVWLSRLQLTAGTSTLPGMFVGMLWGMVSSVALFSAFFACRNHAVEAS